MNLSVILRLEEFLKVNFHSSRQNDNETDPCVEELYCFMTDVVTGSNEKVQSWYRYRGVGVTVT